MLSIAINFSGDLGNKFIHTPHGLNQTISLANLRIINTDDDTTIFASCFKFLNARFFRWMLKNFKDFQGFAEKKKCVISKHKS